MLESGGFMNTNDIVLAIDAKIEQLRQARAFLKDAEITTKRKQGHPAGVGKPDKSTGLKRASSPGTKRRTMSAESRAKIAEAQRVRWAKSKKAAKNIAHKLASAPAQKGMTAKLPHGKATEVK